MPVEDPLQATPGHQHEREDAERADDDSELPAARRTLAGLLDPGPKPQVTLDNLEGGLVDGQGRGRKTLKPLVGELESGLSLHLGRLRRLEGVLLDTLGGAGGGTARVHRPEVGVLRGRLDENRRVA